MDYFVTCVLFLILQANACCQLSKQLMVIKSDQKVAAEHSTFSENVEVGTERICTIFVFMITNVPVQIITDRQNVNRIGVTSSLKIPS